MTPTVPLHHRIEGPPGAPLVIMTHSLGSTAAMWRAQAEALSSRLRIVRCDLRGHGLSPVPPGPYDIADLAGDVLALLDRLGAARAHLVGLSLGGMIGMWLAAHHPDRVDRLVLCCTSALLGPPERWQERAARVLAGGSRAVADEVVSRWLTPDTRARRPDLATELAAMVSATPAAGYAACCGAIERMDLRADLPSIRAPTLAIAGADDPSTPPDHLLRIADAIPGARAVVVERAAHMAAVERPDEVTALIAAHLHQAHSSTGE
jgi:3-oxoadipate enol-lactonase